MALPALLAGGSRALATGSRLARTANVGRKLLGTKSKKNKQGQVGEDGPSTLTVRPSTTMVPTTFRSSGPQNVQQPVDVKVTPATGKSTLEEDVRYIKDKTIEIDKLLKGSFAQRKKEEAALRKERAAARRKGKEERFEKGGRGMLGKATDKVKKPFSSIWEGIKNYLTAVLLGFLAVRLAPLLPKLLDFAKLIAPAIEFVLDAAGFLLNGLVTFIDWGYKAYDATRGFIKTLGGENAVKVFDKFSDVFNKVMNLALILAMVGAAGGGLGGGGRGGGVTPRPRPGQGLRPKVTTTGGRGVGRPDIRSPLRDRPRVTTTGGGAAGTPGFRNPLRSRPTVTTGAGRVAGELGEQGLKRAAGTFIRPLVKRIPLFGALIDFAIAVLLGESLGRAAARATGAGIGGAAGAWLGGVLAGIAGSVVPILGTAIGGAVGATIGSIAGGMLGDWIGGSLYDVLTGKQPKTEKPKSTIKAKAAGGYIDPISTGDTVAQSYQTGGLTGLLGGLTLPPIPKFSIPDLSAKFVGGAIGGLKNLLGIGSAKTEGIYASEESTKKIVDLANKVKDVPLIGGAMFAALNLALGNRTDSLVFKAIASQLTNFANLNAFGDVSSSLSKLNLVKMATGGQVTSANVTLTPEDNIVAVNNISTYLKTKFSDFKLDLPPETEKPSAGGSQSGGTQPGAGVIPGEISAGGITGTGVNKGISVAKKLIADLGITPAQAAGIVGNFLYESAGMNPGEKEGAPYGRPEKPPALGTIGVGYGWAQWTNSAPGDRLDKFLKSYGGDKGKIATDDDNYRYLMRELKGSESLSRKGVITGTYFPKDDPLAASDWFRKNWERAGVPADQKRRRETQAVFDKIRGLSREKAKESVQQTIQRAQAKPEKQEITGSVPKGSVIQWLHGNPSRPGYDSGHAGLSNAHDHFSFKSRAAAVAAFTNLKKAGYKPYEFEGYTRVGKHSATGGHFAAVGAPPTYNDTSDGVAFDIPWASYGSGPIGQRDYDLSYKAARIVGAAQGGGIVPGAFRELQSTMSYDKSKTRVVVQPMVVEKPVPMPMPMGGGTKVIVASGEVNSMADNLFAG